MLPLVDLPPEIPAQTPGIQRVASEKSWSVPGLPGLKRFHKILTTFGVLVSLNGQAEIISSKGGFTYPLPSECENASGGTYGATRVTSLQLPQLNGTELLACTDQVPKKNFFRLRLNVLMKNAEGVSESRVADEIIIPWLVNVYPRNLSVAGPDNCDFTDGESEPTGLGPYALGMWQQQPDDSLLLGEVIVAWEIDQLSKSIRVISSKHLQCRAG